MSHVLKMKAVVSCALLAMSLGPIGAGAAVEQREDLRTRVVHFADLDLTHDTGVETLYSRINSAARQVCESPDAWVSRLHRQSNECRHQAIARAVLEVNSPKLTGYFLSKSQ
jgi:UrcA family protein